VTEGTGKQKHDEGGDINRRIFRLIDDNEGGDSRN